MAEDHYATRQRDRANAAAADQARGTHRLADAHTRQANALERIAAVLETPARRAVPRKRLGGR